MIREIIVPDKTSYQLSFPADMVGKKVEIIAFEIDEVKPFVSLNSENDIESVGAIFRDCKVDLSNYKLDGNQANDYDE